MSHSELPAKNPQAMPSRKRRREVARALKAGSAIRKFVNLAAGGSNSDLFAIARAEGLSPAQLLKAVADDSDLHDLLFGTMSTEAKLLVKTGIAQATAILADETVHPDTRLRWLTYITKLAYGSFQPKEASTTIIANLIPTLPGALQRELEKRKVVEIESEQSLESLLPDEPGERTHDQD